MRTLLAACALVASVCLVSVRAHAQRPEDVQAAAAAFGEGQRAQLRGDYARAADLFELADRSAPSAGALRSAIRNHRAAGQIARAATLSRDAQRRYPGDADTAALATEVLAEAATRAGELHVTCEPACSLAIDGRAAAESAHPSFDLFVDPGTRTLVASWPGREPVSRSVEAVAGGDASVAIEAPPEAAVEPEPEPEPEPVATEPAPEPEPIVEPPPSGGGISPAFFGVSAGLAVVLVGLGTWSGVDTLDARDRYVADPTRAGYEDGVERQWRTTGLFIAAGVCGAAAVVLAIFTDWDGDEPARTERATLGIDLDLPWVAVDASGGAIGITGTFGGGS